MSMSSCILRLRVQLRCSRLGFDSDVLVRGCLWGADVSVLMKMVDVVGDGRASTGCRSFHSFGVTALARSASDARKTWIALVASAW